MKQMRLILSLMAFASLLLVQSCSVDEFGFQPGESETDPYQVSIYSDINQQPASKVTTDGLVD